MRKLLSRAAAVVGTAAVGVVVAATGASAAPCGTDCGTESLDFKLKGSAAVERGILTEIGDGIAEQYNAFLDFYMGPPTPPTAD